MYDAFTVIKHVLPRDYTHINIYGMSDAHIGAKESSLSTLRAWVRTVLDDPYGYVIIAGDMINNGIKDSKTNVYEEVMPPRQQKRVCAEIFKPLADAERILAWIPGNHEERSARSVDDDPSYDICVSLGVEDVWRPDCAIIKISVGSAKKDRQVAYGICVTHGSSQNKHRKFVAQIENFDVAFSGHTHAQSVEPMYKMHLDLNSGTVKWKRCRIVVLPSLMDYASYAIRKELTPQMYGSIPVITLCGTRKRVDYHEYDTMIT